MIIYVFIYSQKIDKMYAAFAGQPLEKIQQYTERDRFFSASEVILIRRKFYASDIKAVINWAFFSLLSGLRIWSNWWDIGNRILAAEPPCPLGGQCLNHTVTVWTSKRARIVDLTPESWMKMSMKGRISKNKNKNKKERLFYVIPNNASC